MITKEGIEAFLEVIKLGNLTQASKALFITQPALSRRIQVLERDLGYELFVRGRGSRKIRLTAEGKAFVSIALQTLELWNQAAAIPAMVSRDLLNLTAVGSLIAYLFPHIINKYLQQFGETQIVVNSANFAEGYRRVESGQAEFALVNPQMVSETVETQLCFREPMVLLSSEGHPMPALVQTGQLDPSYEIRLPWNQDYDLWHNLYFPIDSRATLVTDSMPLMEQFIEGKNWVIAPLTVGLGLSRSGVQISRLSEPPPDHLVYFVSKRAPLREPIQQFLRCMDDVLAGYTGVRSYIPSILGD